MWVGHSCPTLLILIVNSTLKFLLLPNLSRRKKDFNPETNFKTVGHECPTHTNQDSNPTSVRLGFSSSVIQNSVILMRLQRACHLHRGLEGTRC